jgi:hypothetical protein
MMVLTSSGDEGPLSATVKLSSTSTAHTLVCVLSGRLSAMLRAGAHFADNYTDIYFKVGSCYFPDKSFSALFKCSHTAVIKCKVTLVNIS